MSNVTALRRLSRVLLGLPQTIDYRVSAFSSTQTPLRLIASVILCARSILPTSQVHRHCCHTMNIFNQSSKCRACTDNALAFWLSPWQDLKPVDVTNKRSLWENKGASPAKVDVINISPFTCLTWSEICIGKDPDSCSTYWKKSRMEFWLCQNSLRSWMALHIFFFAPVSCRCQSKRTFC